METGRRSSSDLGERQWCSSRGDERWLDFGLISGGANVVWFTEG